MQVITVTISLLFKCLKLLKTGFISLLYFADSFTLAMQKLLLVVPQEVSTEEILKKEETT